MNNIDTPCIKICKTDINGLCIGCKRTRDEIGDWRKYTDEQRKNILNETYKRKIVQAETGGFSF